MKKTSKSYDFYSLKPPKELFLQQPLRISRKTRYFSRFLWKIAQNTNKIVNGVRRREFFSVFDYDSAETQAISAIKLQVAPEIREFSEDLALKCYYCSNFSVQKAAQLFEKLALKRISLENAEFSAKLLAFLESGLAYQLGRDLQYRPIIVIDLSKLEKINDFTLCRQGLMILLRIIEKYMFFAGFIERWTIIVDCREFPQKLTFIAEDLANFLRDFAETFPFSLQKLFIIEPTFEILQFVKTFQATFAENTAEKLVFLENKDVRPAFCKFIAANQLQAKFGGFLNNKRDFWPPKSTFSSTNYSAAPSRVSSQEFLSAKSSIFQEKFEHYSDFSLENSKDFFFELSQKDAFSEKMQEKLQENEKISCFEGCFAKSNRKTVIGLQENSGKKSFCAIF